MNEFKVCDQCSEEKDTTELEKRLRELDSKATIINECQGFCAIGRVKEFVIVNGVPAIADTVDEVIDKVKELLS